MNFKYVKQIRQKSTNIYTQGWILQQVGTTTTNLLFHIALII